MTAQQNRSGGGAPADANASRQAEDPGAYIGRKPERVAETIPGGLGPRDERAAAVATRSGPAGDDTAPPEGHRAGEPASDDTAREAGQDR